MVVVYKNSWICFKSSTKPKDYVEPEVTHLGNEQLSVFLGLCFSSLLKFLKSSSHPEFERNARKSLTSPTALTLSHVQRNTKKTTEKIRSLMYYAAFCTSSTWPHMGHRHTRLRISGRQLISKLWLVFRGGLNKHTRTYTFLLRKVRHDKVDQKFRPRTRSWLVWRELDFNTFQG